MILINTQIWVVTNGWKFPLLNQNQFSDLGSDMLSVWNFCICFPDSGMVVIQTLYLCCVRLNLFILKTSFRATVLILRSQLRSTQSQGMNWCCASVVLLLNPIQLSLAKVWRMNWALEGLWSLQTFFRFTVEPPCATTPHKQPPPINDR